MKQKGSFGPAVNGLGHTAEHAGPKDGINRVSPKKENVMKDEVSTVNYDRAEALLRSIIKYWIVQLMDYGGTCPVTTAECVLDKEPALCKAIGKERVLALCKELHRAENISQSEWYQARFHQFNNQYFGGTLPDYRVHAVYDITVWAPGDCDEFPRSDIDHAAHEIYLSMTHCVGFREMDELLIHFMAHVATGTSTDEDFAWHLEMERLRQFGAPVDASPDNQSIVHAKLPNTLKN